jgi:hypothetical protein
VPLRARLTLVAGLAATIWANVAYGLPQGATGALLGVWPVAGYFAAAEILVWMREHLDTSKPASALRRARELKRKRT